MPSNWNSKKCYLSWLCRLTDVVSHLAIKYGSRALNISHKATEPTSAVSMKVNGAVQERWRQSSSWMQTQREQLQKRSDCRHFHYSELHWECPTRTSVTPWLPHLQHQLKMAFNAACILIRLIPDPSANLYLESTLLINSHSTKLPGILFCR